MERREHPRVELPIEVEFSHPSIGSIKTTATDISEGGIYVEIEDPPVPIGAKVKITVLGLPLVASTPTPTINMEVARRDKSGLGLKFDTAIARHLWESVERYRDELAVGRDYFQVYQGALVLNAARQLLVVKQHGKWLYPGEFLVVGQDWRPAVADMLDAELGLSDAFYVETLGVDSLVGTRPENAIFAVFHRYGTASGDVQLGHVGRFSDYRWIASDRELRDLSFSDEKLRPLATVALEHARKERSEASPGHGT